MANIQLLVSVRDANEAIAAADGGANIVDVKDPEQGSLGFAGWQTIQTIQQTLQPRTVLSAALGELSEWQAHLEKKLLKEGCQPIAKSLPVLQFAKIGLARQGGAEAAKSDCESAWIAEWKAVRSSLSNVQQWVAVAYSDFNRCDAPGPEIVLDAAIETDCRILLLDTFVKDGQTTFDHLSSIQLSALIKRSHGHGLQVAIAGQVSADDLAQIRMTRPDIVAVRGAVCEDQDRRKRVLLDEVVKLRKSLDSIC